MTTEKTTPNFFILLGLNPDDLWDELKFEQTLREKRIEWSRQGSSVGVKALNAKKNLEMIPEIRRVMTDPDLRSAQAAGAKAELLSNRKARIESFEKQLAFAEKKGYLEKREYEELVKEFKDVFSEDEIARHLTVKVQEPDLQSTVKLQQLDPSMLKAINERLKTINKSSLYDLLEMPDTTSRQELSNAAQRLYDEMIRRQPKTAEVTVKSDLAGHATNIFKSDEMRSKYDQSLRQSKLESILQVLDKTVGRTTEKVVHAQQVILFLENASKAGWKPEYALIILKEHARERKWSLEVPAIEQRDQKQRCGYCHELNEKERNFCRGCNKELHVTCPQCGKNMPSDEIGCDSCGFPVGNRYLVDELLAEIHDLLSFQDLKAAEERLIDAERVWPLSKPDARLQQIRTCRTELERRVQIQQHILEQLRQFMDQRKLFSARQLLAEVATIPNRQASENTVETGIAQAQNLLRQAQSPNLSREKKVEFCLQALRICTDYKDARDLLSTMPPEPPSNLQAKLTGTIVNLTWDLSPSQGIQYQIVRKSRSQPLSAKNGEILGTITGRAYDDTMPEIGVPLFYAVFAVYEDVSSAQGAILQEPMLLVQDVTNVRVRVDDSMVDLSWKAPSNVYNIVAVRKENMPPNSLTDGKQLTPVDPTHLVDRDVKNNRSYFYGIYCQFKHHNGRLVTSSGVFTSKAIPEPPPEVITHLDIASAKIAQGHEVILKWDPPSKGDVIVLRSEQQVSIKVGDTISQATLNQHGLILEGRQNSARDEWTQPGIGYYVPVVVYQGMAYIGVAQRFVCVDDIDNLKVDNIGTALRLQWTWPANCEEAIVAFSYDRWPEPAAGTANTYKITRAQYDLHGHYDIRGAMNRDHFIVVAAVIRQGSDQVIAPGVRKQTRLASKIALSYEIKPRLKFVRKQPMLHLHMRVPGKLPTLLLVTKRNSLPFNKADGELLYRLSEMELTGNEVSLPLPDSTFPPNTYSKLFLEDDRLYDLVNVYHPSMDKLRLD